MQLSAILAMSENRVIGQDNQLPWHLPADLKYFKKITMGHPIIMGRKTYQSIGRALPGRLNIILTQQRGFTAAGCEVVSSVTEAIDKVQSFSEAFVIGGASVLQEFLPYVTCIYLTVIAHTFPGDTYLPELPSTLWQEISREDFAADSENPYAYSFRVLKKYIPILPQDGYSQED